MVKKNSREELKRYVRMKGTKKIMGKDTGKKRDIHVIKQGPNRNFKKFQRETTENDEVKTISTRRVFHR